jgi:hypothetical protein
VWGLALQFAAFGPAAGAALAGSAGQERLLSKVLEGWDSRRASVQSLECSASVDTYYPADGLAKGVPSRDLKLSDERVRWLLHFPTVRLRKESGLTVPIFVQGKEGAPFHKDVTVQTFLDGHFRLFRPRDRNPWQGKGGYDLSENGSAGTMLGFEDLPILWVAGLVSGRYPTPMQLGRPLVPAEWKWGGEVERNGTSLYRLITPEQGSSLAVREFLLGKDAPYPISHCEARRGKQVYWQLRVEYIRQDGSPRPSVATCTLYESRSARLRHQRTYRFQEFKLNPHIGDEEFDEPLKPGMLVRYHRKHGLFRVDENGGVVPLVVGESATRSWSVIVVPVAIVSAVLLAAWFRRRWRCGRSTK